jgi:hypothetical protein
LPDDIEQLACNSKPPTSSPGARAVLKHYER